MTCLAGTGRSLSWTVRRAGPVVVAASGAGVPPTCVPRRAQAMNFALWHTAGPCRPCRPRAVRVGPTTPTPESQRRTRDAVRCGAAVISNSSNAAEGLVDAEGLYGFRGV